MNEKIRKTLRPLVDGVIEDDLVAGISKLIQKEREEDRKVLNISLGNIRARLNGLKKESIDTDNALTIGKIVDLISEVDYKVTEMETYLSQTKGVEK